MAKTYAFALNDAEQALFEMCITIKNSRSVKAFVMGLIQDQAQPEVQKPSIEPIETGMKVIALYENGIDRDKKNVYTASVQLKCGLIINGVVAKTKKRNIFVELPNFSIQEPERLLHVPHYAPLPDRLLRQRFINALRVVCRDAIESGDCLMPPTGYRVPCGPMFWEIPECPAPSPKPSQAYSGQRKSGDVNRRRNADIRNSRIASASENAS